MMHAVNNSTRCTASTNWSVIISLGIAGLSQRVTISISANLDSRGVTEIDRKSLSCLGCGTLGIGVTTADKQLYGT